MNYSCTIGWGICLASLVQSAGAQQSAPVAAAPPPPLVGTLAAHPDWPTAKNPSDVDTVNHLVTSLYDVISGPAGKPRNWERFRSLFLPDGRLGVVRPNIPATKDASPFDVDAVFLTPDMYVQRNESYFMSHGFFERGIANRVETFGNLVQVWSTYESRHAENDRQPFARGINAIQIMHRQRRFWIASILWHEERPGLALPKKYLQ